MTFVYPRPISPADPRCASPVRGAGSLIPEISGVERTSGRQHAGPDGDSRDGQNTPRLGCLVPAEACARGAHLSSSSLSSPTERSRPTDRRCEKTGLSRVGQSLPHSSHSLSPVWAAALEAETKDLIATSHYLNQNKDAITMGINLRLIDDPNTPTALYRYFDEQRRLLYIGITGDLALREQGHISASKWAELVASSTVARYPDRRAALEAERAAIKAECPLFNKQYNDTPAARRRVSAYLDEVDRLDLLDRRPLSLHMPPGELEMVKARKATPKPHGGADLTDSEIVSTRPMGRDEVVLMCVAVLQDARLSLAARGLLALVISLSDRETTAEWLAERVPGGEEAIQGALSELGACGYYRDGVICDEPLVA